MYINASFIRVVSTTLALSTVILPPQNETPKRTARIFCSRSRRSSAQRWRSLLGGLWFQQADLSSVFERSSSDLHTQPQNPPTGCSSYHHPITHTKIRATEREISVPGPPRLGTTVVFFLVALCAGRRIHNLRELPRDYRRCRLRSCSDNGGRFCRSCARTLRSQLAVRNQSQFK